MAKIEIGDKHLPVDVDELKAPKMDAVVGGRTESMSDIGEGCHQHPDHKHECKTFPYLVRQLSVF